MTGSGDDGIVFAVVTEIRPCSGAGFPPPSDREPLSAGTTFSGWPAKALLIFGKPPASWHRVSSSIRRRSHDGFLRAKGFVIMLL